jgi:hypothetical protein
MEKLDEQQGDEAAVEEEVEPSYKFAPEILEGMGRSIPLIIGERLCDAALAKLKEPEVWRTMTFKELRKLFKDNCGDQDGYLSPQAPLLETVVRMLLAAKRDSLTLGEIHADVSGLWITSPWPRHIAIESLQRVLDRGVAYGIIRVE